MQVDICNMNRIFLQTLTGKSICINVLKRNKRIVNVYIYIYIFFFLYIYARQYAFV